MSTFAVPAFCSKGRSSVSAFCTYLSSINMGRGRDVPHHEQFNVHRSVQIRMEAKDLPGGPYEPSATFDQKPNYVD